MYNEEFAATGAGLSRLTLFWQASCFPEQGIYTPPRIHHISVGPVPTNSRYGSKTLIHSAVHMLESCKDYASAHQISFEKITPIVDRDFMELSETQVGVPKISSITCSGPMRWSDAQINRRENHLFYSYFIQTHIYLQYAHLLYMCSYNCLFTQV